MVGSERPALRHMPASSNLFTDRATGTPLRWTLQVEVMNPMADRALFIWQSGHPEMVFGFPESGMTGNARPLLTDFRGINPVTGLPHALEFRDLVVQYGVR